MTLIIAKVSALQPGAWNAFNVIDIVNFVAKIHATCSSDIFQPSRKRWIVDPQPRESLFHRSDRTNNLCYTTFQLSSGLATVQLKTARWRTKEKHRREKRRKRAIATYVYTRVYMCVCLRVCVWKALAIPLPPCDSVAFNEANTTSIGVKREPRKSLAEIARACVALSPGRERRVHTCVCVVHGSRVHNTRSPAASQEETVG